MSRDRLMRTVAIAATAALLGALLYQGLGLALFAPRFASADPRDVLVAYYEAQRWGHRGIAEAALDPDERASRHATNYMRPLVKDTFLASELEVSEAHDIGLHGKFAEEVQFTVSYESRWRNEIGEPPGPRYWFVYLGRDPDGPWRVLSEGTGP